MAKDVIVSVSVFPASELLSQTVLAILDTVNAAKEVVIQKENFQKFSFYLEKITCILKELSKLEIECSESLKHALEILNREVKVAKQLALECRNRNKVYLLINCRKILKGLAGSTKAISSALSLFPLASLNISLGLSDEISKICKNMLDAEYQTAIVEEEILGKIESAIQERNVDSSCANNLLVQIAEAVGISTDQSTLKKEFEEFKSGADDAALRKGMAEAVQMEQIIALLENADATTSREDKEMKYFEERNSLGRQPLEPLRSFHCPITQEVMVDPVETSSGRTFERSAIEKWLADGNNRCPLTDVPLKNLVLRPNKTLQNSIREWKDRNTIIIIASIKYKLQSNEEQEVLQSLCKLQEVCMERELHREWVTMEDYTPVLLGLLSTKNCEIRKHALAILCTLAKDRDDTQERIAKVNNALESIVRSLARPIEESKLAVQLLLDLSNSTVARDLIGTVQGCIFLLVTMLNSSDIQAARIANEILENVSFLDQNVIQMAKANYFKPLLQLLSSGPESVRMVMAETLSEIELTDQNKLSLCKDGALEPLLQFLSHGNIEMKKAAVKALQNLSNLPQNGLQMIRQGALGPLFELLYRHSLSSPSMREQVAAIIMHLAISTATTQAAADDVQISLLESEEDIFKLFSLVSLTGPDIQRSILRTFYAICQSPSGPDIRAKLRQLSAVQVLVQLCEHENQSVRANAMKLFCCLTKDDDNSTFLEHVGPRCIETLVRIIETSNDEEEIAAAMGIIANLPRDHEITQWCLDAGALQQILACLTDGNRNALHKREVIENSVEALCRFSVPTNQEWQKRVAKAGIIPVLVQLLISGSALTKQNAAISLKQLSESSIGLSKPVKGHVLLWCCLAAPEARCPAHLGICTVESSFCIVKANALEPLVMILGEKDIGACEASLDALFTLIDGEKVLQSGGKVLAEANAIAPTIKLLSSPSARVQQRSLETLERIFRVEELKLKYGTSAHMPLVDIAQKGSSNMKSLAAKLLAQLDVLGIQSSYF